MGDDEVEAALDAAGLVTPEPPMSTDATLAYVRELMTKSGVAPRFYDRRPPAAPPAAGALREAGQPATLARRVPDEFPMREDPGMLPSTPSPGTPAPMFVPVPGILPPMPAQLPARSPTGDRSTWERLAITPDVEIHVRRPLDRRTNKLVERLARIARELFEDEP
jgi:hypothetical protein